MGRTYEAIFSKEKTVYLVETGDFVDRKPDGLIDRNRKTILDIIDWHNCLEDNQGQVSCAISFLATILTLILIRLWRNGQVDLLSRFRHQSQSCEFFLQTSSK